MRKLIVTIIIGFSLFNTARPCTIFTITHNGKTYFCNNEDLDRTDTELRVYPAEQGKFGWIYLGYSNDWAQGGVNEKGLCWDWVAGYNEDSWKEDEDKLTVDRNPSEKMIKECATVDEAINFYKTHNEPSFSVGRIMIADKFGNSAIIRWKDGKIDIQKNNELQILGFRGECIKSYFANNPGEINVSYLADALNAPHQGKDNPTQYSNIISLNDGKIYLFKSHDYNAYLEIDYLKLLQSSNVNYKLTDLFHEIELSEIKYFKRQKLTSLQSNGKLKNGIKYQYYEGAWDFLPDFKTIEAKFSGVVDNFHLNKRQSETNFALRFNGYIEIEQDGVYTFYLNSNDGSQLFLDNRLVVANYGKHALFEESGKVDLEKGIHKITVLYFQAQGSYGLEVSYKSEKFDKTRIPETILYYNEN